MHKEEIIFLRVDNNLNWRDPFKKSCRIYPRGGKQHISKFWTYGIHSLLCYLKIKLPSHHHHRLDSLQHTWSTRRKKRGGSTRNSQPTLKKKNATACSCPATNCTFHRQVGEFPFLSVSHFLPAFST